MSEVAVGVADEKQSSQAVKGQIRVEITADVNITAPIARRLVNTQLMLRVGQMIMAGDPELVIEGQKISWKVPFLVVPPEGDPSTYPTGTYALVDAITGLYTMTKQEIEALKVVSDPILDRLYPDLAEWLEKVQEVKAQ
ncbi:MAG: hypothetical protein HY709_11610 [Candidatus Latescibacteria bacterium]|nr:hypothetical protein [Candidatus Latescibacterota bacterium]